MPGPVAILRARRRALALPTALATAGFLLLSVTAVPARAASCSGTLTGSEVSFQCDTAMGDNSPESVFRLAFGSGHVDSLGITSPPGVTCEGTSPSGAPRGLSYVLCSSPVIPAGTTVTGTMLDIDGGPVCGAPATGVAYGPDDAYYHPTVVATFSLTGSCPRVARHTLSITRSGTGSGTVLGSSSQERFTCPATCAPFYPAGTIVTLTAAPATGSTFTGWSGDGGCHGTGTCVVTLTADTSVKAALSRSAAPVTRVSITHRARVTGTSVRLALHCTAAKGRRCTVLETLTATEHLTGSHIVSVSARARHRTRRVTLARRSFSIAAGRTSTLTVSLNATGRALLARFHYLRAHLAATLTNVTKPVRITSGTVSFSRKTKRTTTSR